MAKPNIQDILLQKGDKIALGVGAALVGGLTLWGVANFATADSPTALVKQFDGKATTLKSQVAAEGTDAAELPAWVMKGADKVPIDAAQFALAGTPFEPIDKPDTLRSNPKVLWIDNAQIDFVRFPMRAYDIRVQEDGNVLVGVKVTVAKGETDAATIKKNLDGLTGRSNLKFKPPVRAPLPPGIAAMINGLQGGRPGSPGGSPGIPGSPGGSPGIPGSPGGSPGTPGSPGAYPGDSGGSPNAARDDQTVAYMTPAEALKSGKPLAETVYPLRAVIVTATFPIKKQIEEVRQSLRAKTNEEAIALAAVNGSAGPVFAGFEVDRRVLVPGGAWSDWTPYDHKAEYLRNVYARAIDTVPDAGNLLYFVPPADQEMVYPLPVYADGLGEYKKITIPSIVKEMAELTKLSLPKMTESEFALKFSGKSTNTNPFVPLGIGSGSGVTSGPGVMPGPGAMPGPGVTAPGVPPSPFPGGPGNPSGGLLVNQPDPAAEVVEHKLLRFLDTDVQPGVSYQYRVKVKMRNPNYGKPSLVGKLDDAKREILEGPWLEIPEIVTAPSDNFLYAGDSLKYVEDSTKLIDANGKEAPFRKFLEVDEVRDGRRAVVEIQRWMPSVRIGETKSEPIGTWVIGKLPVGPGEFIGKRQFLELPLWSGGLGNYVLRELAGGLRIFGIKDAKHQPKGWPLQFRSASILIDFDGGKVRPRVNDREVSDDADSELLILQPDGKVTVRNSGADGVNRDRKERDTVWTDWVARVKERRDVAVPATGTPGAVPGGGFTRPGSN